MKSVLPFWTVKALLLSAQSIQKCTGSDLEWPKELDKRVPGRTWTWFYWSFLGCWFSSLF